MAAVICVNVIQITRKENIKTFSDWEFKFSQLPINSFLPFVSFCHFMLSKVIDSFSVQTNICNAKTHITMRPKLLIYEKNMKILLMQIFGNGKFVWKIWIESTNSEKKTENICPLFSIHICWCYCNCVVDVGVRVYGFGFSSIQWAVSAYLIITEISIARRVHTSVEHSSKTWFGLVFHFS